jgi:hypothetical protein
VKVDVILGAGADASVNWDRSNSEIYEVNCLETTFFNPVEAKTYLNGVLKAAAVQEYIEAGWGRRKPVYIITGLKIARGAKAKSSQTRGHGGALSIGLDGTALAAPVEVGPEFELQREKKTGVEWGSSDDFVFAYRISRLKLKKGKETAEEEEYRKGALYGLPMDRKSNTVEMITSTFELDDLDDEDAVAAEFDDEEVADVEDEDGEKVAVIMPFVET